MSHNFKIESYLEIIIGSMYSGKTSRLVEIYRQCNFCDIPVVVINHSFDNRYDEKLLSTHDQIKIPCIKTEKLNDLFVDLDLIDIESQINSTLKTSKVILINEAQFFSDLESFVKTLLQNNKIVYLFGLDGDFERKKFGQILDLIPICDNVIKLKSLCGLCKNGTYGIFSKRITSEKEQTIIGSDNYIPVCRKCYEI